jgi:ATP-dependent helicase/nuclease subunit B
MAAAPHIYSIPAGIPFARALAAGAVQRCGGGPLLLADALVLVPTRRAARALRDAFAEAQAGAALLPRLFALGDVDEEDVLFDPSTDDILAKPAISPLRRRLLLARMVQRWSAARGQTLSLAQAAVHAGELGRFLDEAMTQGVDLKNLETLAPEIFAEHWQEVVAFLRIIAVEWPKLLAAEDRVDAASRRDAQLRRLAAELAANPPRAPVIAAGSTGSIPATAELLKTIAHLPSGAVVLPGLDTELDKDGWDNLDAGHAQYGLRQLLSHIGLEREDVAPWSPLPPAPEGSGARVRFVSQALRPPPTTHAWRGVIEEESADWDEALKGVALFEAQNPREEALAIACALREALETPARTAALVTPDRGLARRVAAELARWDIAVDDSAGVKLSRTPPGAFLALLARAAAEDFAPVPLLALLKHPLAAGGEERAQFRSRVRQLEMWALRGLRPAPGFADIARRCETKKGEREPPKFLSAWWARLCVPLQAFADALAAPEASVGEIAAAHARAAESLATSDTDDGARELWRGTAGEAAAHLIAELAREGADIPAGGAHSYAELFRDIAELKAVRPAYNLHPRIAILGPLEARLLDFDLVILGGLNEGTWPAEAGTDPFLSRPMRKQLGLEPPERRTGLAAHDFAMLAASRNVLLTRALKENGTPTVASRWLLRIKQLAKGLKRDAALAAAGVAQWVCAVDATPRETRCPRPAPRPRFDARPRGLSVTEIETWLRDPYAIYAKHVLRLRPLDAIDEEPGPLQRGVAIHAALEKFLRAYPNRMPDNAAKELLRFGDEAFAEAGASDAVLALWRPRFIRAAHWFLDYETERRAHIAHSAVELRGELEIAGRMPFKLRGRADRIDLFPDGSAAILDYKTGRVPSDKQIREFKNPQLPLEAAMLKRGAFGDTRADSVTELVHIRLTGGEVPGEARIAGVDADAVAEEALARLARHIALYDNEDFPYRSRAMPERVTDVGDYDHLARVREWSRGEDE